MRMRMRLFFILCCGLGAPPSAIAAISDFNCDDRTRLTATLEGSLRAKRQGVGLRDPGTTLEVWVTPENGDWMIVQHYASGTSCIVAMGEYWETARPNPA